MEPISLCPASLLIIFIIIVLILSHAPKSLCQDTDQYAACGDTYQCANIANISYPFWGGYRPDYCGHPNFQLNCSGDVPLITIMSREYRVLGIQLSTQTLTVSRGDLWNTVCPQFLYNTTLDFNLFNYVSHEQDLTLYYGCSGIPGGTVLNQFFCVANNSSSSSFYTTSDVSVSSGFNQGSCSNKIIVRVNQTAAQLLVAAPTVNNSRSLLQAALASGFSLLWNASNASCNQCEQSGGRCGYEFGSFACHCANGSYPLWCHSSSTSTPNGSGSTNNIIIKLSTGIGAALIGILSMSLVIFFIWKSSSSTSLAFWKRKTKDDKKIEAFIRQYGSLVTKRYKYSDVKKMTKSFKIELGRGGYGSVYKGKLPDGRLVAVKVLSASKGNGEEFINEVASIGRTSHVNVVRLLGFCYESQKRALIYEFMPNGSLEKFIYHESRPLETDQHLRWEKLHEIALGIARGLEYLHQGCNTRILHLDIKPHNILLDEDFCPKISDFGLAKLYNWKESIISMLEARGTIGYIAPEVYNRNFGRVSHKSDVYSYGMMILEMVGGRKNIDVEVVNTSEIYFPHWIYERFVLDKDLHLQGIMSKEENEIARKLILVGLWCIQTDPSQRPSMNKAIEMLEKRTEASPIPPKPFLFSPTRSPANSSTE